jgi:hypothetical protein
LYSEENSCIGLSKASLFNYWEPEFKYASEKEWVNKEYNEYLRVLETDEKK